MTEATTVHRLRTWIERQTRRFVSHHLLRAGGLDPDTMGTEGQLRALVFESNLRRPGVLPSTVYALGREGEPPYQVQPPAKTAALSPVRGNLGLVPPVAGDAAASSAEPAPAGEQAQTVLTVAEAIAQLDPENPEHYTKGGKPQTSALEQILGRPVSAAERDAALSSEGGE